MTIPFPSPLRTLQSVARCYLPRVVQARGWALAAMPLAPVVTAIIVAKLVEMQGGRVSPAEGIKVFHEVIVKIMVPIMALVAAPVGIREDLEQRTLPLMLVRPAPAWVFPIAKGLPWYLWGALWLCVAASGLLALGSSAEAMLRGTLALVSLYWAELAFFTLLGLVLKRGTLWGALFIFIWDPLVRIMPGNLQRITFMHYGESIAGSRASEVGVRELFAQAPVESPVWLAVLILLVFGFLCWAACGWKLHSTPVGLAGRDSEG
jgi:hypothetical protein